MITSGQNLIMVEGGASAPRSLTEKGLTDFSLSALPCGTSRGLLLVVLFHEVLINSTA